MDDITIFVERVRPVFIPNVFSPNEDGNNDIFYIQAGPQVTQIKSFYIYSRWGESLFEVQNFQPNDPAFGWDGTHRGREVNTGVYVFMAEVEFNDGQVLIYKGDVTLMR
jgi:gliding motility-associated-like protein